MLKRFFGLGGDHDKTGDVAKKPRKVLIEEAQERALEYGFRKIADMSHSSEFFQFFEDIHDNKYHEGVSEKIQSGIESEKTLKEVYHEFISDLIVDDGQAHDEMEFLQDLATTLCLYESCIGSMVDHIDVLIAKKTQLIYSDEFGHMVRERWEKYFSSYFSSKLGDAVDDWVLKNRLIILNALVSGDLNERGTFYRRSIEDEAETFALFKRFVEIEAEFYISCMDPGSSDNEGCHDFEGTGHEYEYHLLSRLQNETNVNAEVTSGSGDQGADLIVYSEGQTYVVQAKHYTSPVGNKAVQEAFSALSYYRADHAIVVTNAGFTKSANELALRTGVKCLDESQLISMFNGGVSSEGESKASKSFFHVLKETFDSTDIYVENVSFDDENLIRLVKLDFGEETFIFCLDAEYSGAVPSVSELEFYQDLLDKGGSVNVVKIVPNILQPDMLQSLTDLEGEYEDGELSFVTEKEAIEIIS